MIIIHNKNIPWDAATSLQKYGRCIPFSSQGVTDSNISCHPDVFCCNIGNKLISNLLLLNILHNNNIHNIDIVAGKSDVGFGLEATHYNAVVTDKFIIHNKKFTDPLILELATDRKYIAVNQGFTRCSLLPLPDNSFITSDKGIAKKLSENNINHLLVSTEDIILPGYSQGCIGGCFGISGNTVFVIGNMKYHKDGKVICQFIETKNCQLIELYDGPLFDGGSIIIVH